MIKKRKYLLVLTLLVIFMSVVIVDAQEVSTETKVDLVDSLEGLREAMSKKINCDIDITAQAFTDVKDYWRSKRLADIFTVPLRILEDTLSVLNKITYIKNLSKGTNAALNNSETLYQVLSIVMMYQDLQKVGEKLYWGLNGPNYVASIESMLEEADATFIPPFGDNWEKYYKEAIENYLYGTTETTPIIIPRRSTTAERKNIEFAKGALQVRNRIARTFKDLIKEIESKELPEDFPIDEVIIQVRGLTKQIHKSMSYNTDVEYKTHFQDHVKVRLGAVGEQYRAFGQVAGMVDKNLEIEQRIEVLKLMETIESAALLYTTIYKIPGAEEIKIAQKAAILSEIIINPYKNTFYSDSEEVFYMLPQEMILSMPTELSNLWMIADDIDQYLRCFYQAVAKPIITSPLKITPSSPYYVGDTINAEFTITNKDEVPITLNILTIGGRDSDNQIADFTHRQNIILKPSESYDYQGSLFLDKIGDYHFFCTYQTPDGDWNTSIDLGPGLTDEDRAENIVVESREKPSQGLVRIGDFSIDLTKVERSKDTATLSFAITKVNDTGSAPDWLQVTLIDDHENKYSNELYINIGDHNILNALPKGFTYVDSINISIPKIAPIDRIRLRENEIPFKEVHFCQPKLKQDFGTYNIKPGATFNLSKYLKFTIAGPKAGVTGWTLPITVKNTEYNPLYFDIEVVTQFTNGQVSWSRLGGIQIPGVEQKIYQPKIILSLIEGAKYGWFSPKMLVIGCYGGPKAVLKLMPVTCDDFPPLPERITFYSISSGIMVTNIDGSQVDKLTRGAKLACSPNGRRIAFVYKGYIYLINADGSGKFKLTEGSFPNWSPDGRRIAFQHKGYIYLINADGSGKFKLTEGSFPNWSPDGRRIAFVYKRCICIGTESTDGSIKYKIISKGEYPAWSPDGKKIAFNFNDCLGNDIYTMNSDGSGIDKLIDGGSMPIWSPDGTKIAASGHRHFIIVNADGSGKIIIGEGAYTQTVYPIWSPDGKKIVFVYDPTIGGRDIITIINADGSGRTEIAFCIMGSGLVKSNASWVSSTEFISVDADQFK